LFEVTVDDLHRVYEKYFTQFLDPKVRVSVLVTGAGETVKGMVDVFSVSPLAAEVSCPSAELRELFAIDFRQVNLKDMRI
jgi:hypothetical protein